MGPIKFSPENREKTMRCGDVVKKTGKAGREGCVCVCVKKEGGREMEGGTERQGWDGSPSGIGFFSLVSRR